MAAPAGAVWIRNSQGNFQPDRRERGQYKFFEGLTGEHGHDTDDPVLNQIHVGAYVLESFLLPLSVLGLAGLVTMRRRRQHAAV